MRRSAGNTLPEGIINGEIIPGSECYQLFMQVGTDQRGIYIFMKLYFNIDKLY